MKESVAIADGNQSQSEGFRGIVIAVQANFYQVKLTADQPLPTAELPPEDPIPLLLCTRRILLKKMGQKVMVGDQVMVEEPDWIDHRGVISHVFPRKTELDRPPVANADQILLVFALEEPALDPWQLSRFLIKAESTQLEICLCLNKRDLISATEVQQWQIRLQSWGYDPVFMSVETNQGLEQLTQRLQQKISIVAGPSGVGKSSLINHLIPHLNLRVGAVSGKLHRGRHTTRHVELFELPDQGLLADTPGFNQPSLTCEPIELASYFPEARQRLSAGSCQFNDCLHRDEPDCVVRGDWERYEYYLKFLDEAIRRQEQLLQSSHQEEQFKVKITESGKKEYEPLLESKKYRRRSRRKKHQHLQDLYDEMEEEF